MIMVIPIRENLRMVPLMVKEPSNLMRVGFIKVSSSLGKPMAKEN